MIGSMSREPSSPDHRDVIIAVATAVASLAGLVAALVDLMS
jgi:hypothetical protein